MSEQEKDEEINGAQVAAAILNRLAPADKARIVQAIQIASPDSFKRIEACLWNFEDIASLTEQSVQILVSSVEMGDVVLSLKTASEATKLILLKNMSERKRELVENELASMPPVKLAEVENAQRRILQKLDELRALGKVRSRVTQDVWV